jgi:hypothetical protein
MANSTTNLDTISSTQSEKEVTANELLDAASQVMIFGRHGSACELLTWGYYGGRMLVDGVLTSIANGTLSLTSSSTNYIEATAAGVVSANTTGFTAGRIPLYTVTTNTTTVSSYNDFRSPIDPRFVPHKVSIAITTANVTLTAEQARCRHIILTGTLTGNRDLIVPNSGEWVIDDRTSGAFSITVKTSAGTGETTTQGEAGIYVADGTNVFAAASGGSGADTTQCIAVACSDETTALTTGTAKVTFRMPYAFSLSGIRASLSTAQTSGSIFTVDVNEAGTTIISTKITIDNGEKTSTTAATAAVISDSSLADDAEITIDIDQVGDGTAKGLKVYLIGTKV